MMTKIASVSFLALLLGGCSSLPDLPSLDDVGSFIGLSSEAETEIANREECAALDMAIAANLSSSINAREEEIIFADAFREKSAATLDEAVRLRMQDDGVARADAYRVSSDLVRDMTRDKAVSMNERIIRDDTGVLDNEWVNDQRLDCQEALS